MPNIHIEIKPIIKIKGTLAVGTGFRRGLIHRTVARDSDGFAYIPASSFKGRVRRACEQLARRFDICVCQPPRPERMCSDGTGACLVCRVFGRPGATSGLHWRDARLSKAYREAFEQDKRAHEKDKRAHEKNKHAQFYARSQVQLSRALGVAAPGKLFTSESTIEDLEFEAAVTGRLQYTPIDDEVPGGFEILLLLAGLKLVNTVGGSASRGAGWMSCHLPDQIEIGTTKVSWKDVLKNLEWLEYFDMEAADEH